jgi:KaiC/GvpD/RAD55 family RecA-like ATPase
MVLKQNIITERKYVILIKDESIYNQLEKDLSNLILYKNLNFDEKWMKYLKKQLKILVLDPKDYYEMQQKFLTTIYVDISKKSNLKDVITYILYNNTGIINVSDYNAPKSVIEHFYIPTGFSTLDYTFNDLQDGQLTLIGGVTFNGKSCLLDNIFNNAIEKEFSVLYIDGEHTREQKIRNCEIKMLGVYPELITMTKVNKRVKPEVNELGKKIIKEWEKDKFWLYSSSYDTIKKSREELFNAIRYHIELLGCKLILLDNLMSINVIDPKNPIKSETEFVAECKQIANYYHIHVAIVAHYKKSSQTTPDEEKVAGSMNIMNYVDNALEVSREKDEEKIQQNIHGSIKIFKNREEGEICSINTRYRPTTKTLHEIKDGKAEDVRFKRLEEIIKKHKVNISEIKCDNFIYTEYPF